MEGFDPAINYGPNDADRNWIHGDWARQAFETFWANPSYGAPAGANNVATAFRFSYKVKS